MPTTRIQYVDQPFAGRRYTPDTSRLSGLYTGMGDMLAASRMQQAQSNQRALLVLGQLFSNYQETKREQAAATAGAARRQSERLEDKEFTEQQSALARSERATERKDEAAIRAGERKTDAEIRANERAEAAVSKEIDDSPGIVSPALLEAAKKFPNQASRFVLQDGVTVNPMTGAERRAYDRDKKQDADRVEDNKRMTDQFNESKRHNLATEAATAVKAAAPDFYIRDGQVLPLKPGDVTAGDIPYSASAMQGKAGESADVRSMRTAAALNSIDVLKSLAPKRTPGPQGMVEGAWESAKGAVGYNTNVRQYNALLQPTAMQMAVAIQGAAGLSNAEREVFVNMLGKIHAMDYESQMALLDRASDLVGSGADVQKMTTKNQRGETVEKWMPMRSRMPGGVTVNPAAVANPSAALPTAGGGFIEAIDPQGVVHHAPAGTALPAGWKLKQ